MAPLSDQVVAPILAELLGCLETQMALVTSPPAVVCVRPGVTVALLLSQTSDECCEGLAWVRWDSMVPTIAFPEPATDPNPCGVIRWAVTFELGAVRCAPTADIGRVPTCAEWETTVGEVLDDRAALMRAVCCWVALAGHSWRQVAVEGARPMEVEGGCVGSTLRVTISAPACDCVP